MNTLSNNMFSKEMESLKCVKTQQELLRHIYFGRDLVEACALVKVNPAVLGVLRDENVAFDSAIRKAQAFRVELLVDKLGNIHTVMDEAAMAAVVSRNIQWLASKKIREIYGDKMDISHNITIDIKAAMIDARNRVTLENQPNMLIVNNVATDSVSVASDDIDPLS